MYLYYCENNLSLTAQEPHPQASTKRRLIDREGRCVSEGERLTDG